MRTLDWTMFVDEEQEKRLDEHEPPRARFTLLFLLTVTAAGWLLERFTP